MNTQPRNLSLVHIVRAPAVRTPNAKPPLLLLLHGFGSNEHDLLSLAPMLDPRLLVVSARAPITLGQGSYAWYRIQFTADDFLYDGAEALCACESVSRFLAEAVATYETDPQMSILMGFSQGAIMTLGFGLTEPERAARLVAMSGRLLPETTERIAAGDRLSGLPIFVSHGAQDPVIPIGYGREIQSKLSALPVELTYREYAMAHQISESALHDISAWLTAHLSA